MAEQTVAGRRLSRVEWDELARLGRTYRRADGVTCVLEWVDGLGTCLVVVAVAR